MQRGQASVEYVLLIAAVLIGACLLVQHLTPVAAMARAVVHALGHRPRRHPAAHTRRASHRRRRSPAPRPCLCPTSLVDTEPELHPPVAEVPALRA